MYYKYPRYVTLVPLYVYLSSPYSLTHCSPVPVVISCVFVFLFLGGLDISIQLLLPDPVCILAMNFIHKKRQPHILAVLELYYHAIESAE